jgi:hypothetical protein
MLIAGEKCREADVKKLGAALIVSTAVAIVASPHSALAKGDKSSVNLFKNTVKGKHYDKTILDSNNGGGGSKPPKTVTTKPVTNTAADKTTKPTKPVIKFDDIKGEAKDTDHRDH